MAVRRGLRIDRGKFQSVCLTAEADGVNAVEGKGRKAEIGFVVCRACRDRGFAAELVKEMTEYAFSAFRAKVLYGRVRKGSGASVRVLKKRLPIHRGGIGSRGRSLRERGAGISEEELFLKCLSWKEIRGTINLWALKNGCPPPFRFPYFSPSSPAMRSISPRR